VNHKFSLPIERGTSFFKSRKSLLLSIYYICFSFAF